VVLGRPNCDHLLELVYYINPPSPVASQLDRHQVNASHLCFNVQDINDVYNDLSGKGVRFLTPPKFLDREGGSRVGICYAQDPEGNWLEFIEEIDKPEH
jgi:catechol 2,3-dioxygenase-like lactoylglutathione lyase family enzyme